MRNKKLLRAVAGAAVCFTMLAGAVPAAACQTDGSQHEHTYADAWSSDDTHHWHNPTCGDTSEVKDKEAHKWSFGACEICSAAQSGAKLINPTLTEADDNDPEPDADGKIDVVYKLDCADLDTGTYATEWSDGVFSLPAKSVVRARSKGPLYEGDKVVDAAYKSVNSIQLADEITALEVSVNSAGTLVLYVQNGSGSVTTTQYLVMTKPDGTSQDVGYSAANGSNVQRVNLQLTETGKYTFKRKSGTSDLYYASFSTKSEVTPVEKIEVQNGGTVDYYIGQNFKTEGLAVNAIYESTGMIKSVPAGRLTIDYGEFDSSKTGVYNIKVKYEKGGKEYVSQYPVTVYELKKFDLSTFTTNGNKQTSLKQVYIKGETLSINGLTVTATTECEGKIAEFKMNSAQFVVSKPDTSAVGKHTVTVTSTDKDSVFATYDIYVAEKAAVVNNTVQITVNPDEPVSGTNFHTITQAVQYAEAYESTVKKVITVADGEYYEKVWINVPNVTLLGSADNTPNAETDNGVVIWYDAISGKTDASGKSYGTNGSASVTVTNNATGFTACNITFKNKYNTLALYKESLKISSSSQAVALLTESASSAFFNCKFTSYHDTLYSNKGYHYYKDCWIEGHTDFIFGQDAVSYFDNCTIYSIGAGAEEKNGGYIAAYQNTTTEFGPIFNGCDFTSDDNVKAGSIALGRAWGKEFKMVVINSDISDRYSKAAHTAGTQQSQRYCTMSGNEPKPANMVEANNTGDGAITASLDNTCTYDEAALETYGLANLSSLLKFTPVNPNAQNHNVTVNYKGVVIGVIEVEHGKGISVERIKEMLAANSAYSGFELQGVYADSETKNDYAYGAVNEDENIYLKLAMSAVDESVSYNFRTNTADYVVNAGETKYFGKLQVDGNTGSFAQNGDWYKILGDATITVNVKAGTRVTVVIEGSGLDVVAKLGSNILTVAADSTTTTRIFDITEDGLLVLSKGGADASGQTYIGSIAFKVKKIFSQTTTIDLIGEVNIQNIKDDYKGMEVDATNGGKFTLNSSKDWIQFNNGTSLKIYVTPDANVDVDCVTYSPDTVSIDKSRISEGYILVTSIANDYIKSITLTFNS